MTTRINFFLFEVNYPGEIEPSTHFTRVLYAVERMICHILFCDNHRCLKSCLFLFVTPVKLY